MRNVVLLLLLANFGVWAVFSWVIQEPAAQPPYDGPGITLLRELPRAQASDSEARFPAGSAQLANEFGVNADGSAIDAEQTAASSLDGRCISIGPFLGQDEADAAMATLLDAGFEPGRTIREAEVWDGYWVYIDQLESTEAAREVEADLANNGLEDSYILPDSDSGILISLGVFSETTRAMNLAERVRDMGYEATIADSLTTRETHWLDIMLTNEESVALELLQAPGTISRLEQLACAGDSAV